LIMGCEASSEKKKGRDFGEEKCERTESNGEKNGKLESRGGNRIRPSGKSSGRVWGKRFRETIVKGPRLRKGKNVAYDKTGKEMKTVDEIERRTRLCSTCQHGLIRVRGGRGTLPKE